MDLEKLSVEQLQKLLKEEQLKGKEIRNKIRVKMLRISAEMRRYGISTSGSGSATIDLSKNIKQQLIAQIKAARLYNQKLSSQWNQIKDVTGIAALKSIFSGFDNIDTSKQVEILRNLGYSEEEIDIILAQVSGDEDYDELKEKANDIMANYYFAEENRENGQQIKSSNPYM